jgi:hypothetical protein
MIRRSRRRRRQIASRPPRGVGEEAVDEDRVIGRCLHRALHVLAAKPRGRSPSRGCRARRGPHEHRYRSARPPRPPPRRCAREAGGRRGRAARAAPRSVPTGAVDRAGRAPRIGTPRARAPRELERLWPPNCTITPWALHLDDDSTSERERLEVEAIARVVVGRDGPGLQLIMIVSAGPGERIRVRSSSRTRCPARSWFGPPPRIAIFRRFVGRASHSSS